MIACSPLYVTRISNGLKASSQSLWLWYCSARWWWRQKAQPRHSLLGQPPSCPLMERSVTWNCFWRWLKRECSAGWYNFSVSFFFAVIFSKVPTALPSIKWQGGRWAHDWMLFPIMPLHKWPSHDVGWWHFWHVAFVHLIIWQEKRNGRVALPYEPVYAFLFKTSPWLCGVEWRVEFCEAR